MATRKTKIFYCTWHPKLKATSTLMYKEELDGWGFKVGYYDLSKGDDKGLYITALDCQHEGYLRPNLATKCRNCAYTDSMVDSCLAGHTHEYEEGLVHVCSDWELKKEDFQV